MAGITTDPRNANKGTARGRALLEKSMRTYGAGRSVLADKHGTLIAGNKTYETAYELGLPVREVHTSGEELVVVVRDDLDLGDSRAIELAIADNRVGQLDLDWDTEVLAELNQEIDLSQFWADNELAALLGRVTPVDDPGAQVDRAEELRAKWQTERGQLWQIGRHRLLCGDATNAEDVARLMGAERFAGIFTSPPYLQQRTYNGNMAADWHGLMTGVFGALLPHAAADSQIFVNLGLVHRDGRVVRYWDSFIDWMESEGWPLFGWYVWDKLNGMPGEWSGRLAPAHEWVFHFTRSSVRPYKSVATKHAGESVGRTQRTPDGGLKHFTGERDPIQPLKIPDSVIRATNQKPDELINNHPAPFPVAVPAAFLDAWRVDPWIDPFVGSGTTIVAAEQEGRCCYAMDIDPKYVAVSLERLAEMGLEPRLV